MKTEILTAAIALLGAGVARLRWRNETVVNEGHCALLFRNGRFVEKLEAGRHVRWGRHVRVEPVDLRRQPLQLAGQEVLTRDNVSVKASALINWQVIDPEKGLEVQHLSQEVYQLGHQALRSVIAEVTAEELLQERAALGTKMVALTIDPAAALGVKIHSLDVRDVLLPAELRKAFNEVIKARQEGQAALERARGETDALRNLANAARMMLDNPALLNLRILQTVKDVKDAGNNTLILGVPGGFMPLKQ